MLKMQKGVQDKNAHRIDKNNIIRKHLGKYNRKLELMIDLKKSPEHLHNAAMTYGMEWEDFSPTLQEYLAKYAPKKEAPKAAAPKKVSKKEKAEESKEVKEESSDS